MMGQKRYVEHRRLIRLRQIDCWRRRAAAQCIFGHLAHPCSLYKHKPLLKADDAPSAGRPITPALPLPRGLPAGWDRPPGVFPLHLHGAGYRAAAQDRAARPEWPGKATPLSAERMRFIRVRILKPQPARQSAEKNGRLPAIISNAPLQKTQLSYSKFFIELVDELCFCALAQLRLLSSNSCS